MGGVTVYRSSVCIPLGVLLACCGHSNLDGETDAATDPAGEHLSDAPVDPCVGLEVTESHLDYCWGEFEGFRIGFTISNHCTETITPHTLLLRSGLSPETDRTVLEGSLDFESIEMVHFSTARMACYNGVHPANPLPSGGWLEVEMDVVMLYLKGGFEYAAPAEATLTVGTAVDACEEPGPTIPCRRES